MKLSKVENFPSMYSSYNEKNIGQVNDLPENLPLLIFNVHFLEHSRIDFNKF